MRILVTGGAGFIGSKLAHDLHKEGHIVTVLDNFNHYYDVNLKRAREREFLEDITVVEGDILDGDFLKTLFQAKEFDLVCHFAAMAGVRYSSKNPTLYTNVNINGLINLLEVMREFNCKRMVFASSSSVYGDSTIAPYTEDVVADKPKSVYGASKRAGEILLHSYYDLYGIESTCLRFFTVYGPWTRPDMAMLKFAERMKNNEVIQIYNYGKLKRDFTHIDDIVSGFKLAVEKPLGYEVLNLGRGEPVDLLEYVYMLEEALGMKAKKEFHPMQAGDVHETYADITKARELLGFSATVDIKQGIQTFAEWFNSR